MTDLIRPFLGGGGGHGAIVLRQVSAEIQQGHEEDDGERGHVREGSADLRGAIL